MDLATAPSPAPLFAHMSQDPDSDAIDNMVADFFLHPSPPCTCHEEWLLRLCSELMRREATVVSVAEKKANAARRRGGQCRPPSSLASPPCTDPSEDTERTLSSAS